MRFRYDRLPPGHPLEEYDMDDRPTHDEDGVVLDWVLDHALAVTRANAEAKEREHVNGDEPESFEQIKSAAYNEITRVLQHTAQPA